MRFLSKTSSFWNISVILIQQQSPPFKYKKRKIRPIVQLHHSTPEKYAKMMSNYRPSSFVLQV
eukprot:UN03944